MPDMNKITQEAREWKEKAEEQHRFVKQLEEEIDINEIQEKITQQTIDDQQSKILQMQMTMEQESKKKKEELDKRYSNLVTLDQLNEKVSEFI